MEFLTRKTALVLALALALSATAARGEVGIVSTRHNLSATGTGPIKATRENRICIFCHVSHGGASLGVNRPLSTAAYRPYESTTMASPKPGPPDGGSRICLSCHDGTIAIGETRASGRIEMTGVSSGGVLPEGATNLGTDLRLSHPVSFAPGVSHELRAPAHGDVVKLDGGGRVQCTSCHDPHRDDLDAIERKFLVKSNRGSALCLSCHTKLYWLTNPSTHESSTAVYDAAHGASTAYTTVGDNGCESCHRPHGAATTSRLLRAPMAQLCLGCHNGSVARTNVQTDLSKPYNHPVLTSDPALHDAAESPGQASFPLPERSATTNRHVQCADCHNSHATMQFPAVAPNANGFLSGTWGIDRNGARVEPVQYQYEVCFKCHGDSANEPQVRGPTAPETLSRQVVDVNMRRLFDLDAPSSHPVEGPGQGRDVPSLIWPPNTAWPNNASTVIYCTDCHASDSGPGAGGQGAVGPHGSSYRHILERNLSTDGTTVESPFAYALCYKCHDREILMNPKPVPTDPKSTAFRLHQDHVQRLSAPCTACHDSHGVSAIQGNPANNAHLINFDVSVVQRNARGLRLYTSAGYRSGRCSLRCHDHEHDDAAY